MNQEVQFWSILASPSWLDANMRSYKQWVCAKLTTSDLEGVSDVLQWCVITSLVAINTCVQRYWFSDEMLSIPIFRRANSSVRFMGIQKISESR